MTDVNYTPEDVIKIYEAFVKEKFKFVPRSNDIINEFRNFKAQILNKLTELDESQFENFSHQKKNEIQSNMGKIKQEGDFRHQGRNMNTQNQDFSLFEILKLYSDQPRVLEAYLSSFRIHDPEDLAFEWKSEDEKASNLNSPFISEVKPIVQLDSMMGTSDSNLSYLIAKEQKTDFRYIGLGNEFSFVEKLLFSVFIAFTERKMKTLESTISYFTNLYNISHHFGLKTEHFLLFNSLCKYFQYIIYSLLDKEFKENNFHQAFVMNLLSSTAHNGKIVKGVVYLLLEVVKITLEFVSEEHLRKILTVYPKDPLALFKQEMEMYMNQLSSNFGYQVEDLDFKTREIFKNIVYVLCFCFKLDMNCVMVFGDNTNEKIHSGLNSNESYPMVISCMKPNLNLTLYGKNDAHLVEKLKIAQKNFNLEEFFSANKADDMPGNKENYISSEHLRKQPINSEINLKRYNKDYKKLQERQIQEEASSKVELSKNRIDYSRSQISNPDIVQTGKKYQGFDERVSVKSDYNIGGSQRNTAGSRNYGSEKEGFYVDQLSFEITNAVEIALNSLSDTLNENSDKIYKI